MLTAANDELPAVIADAVSAYATLLLGASSAMNAVCSIESPRKVLGDGEKLRCYSGEEKASFALWKE